MKKFIAICLSLLIVMTGLSACSSTRKIGSAESKGDKESKISVVTTIFPVYDWTRNVAGLDNSNVDISMLVDSGVDLHSFQPSAEDMLKISECDVFIYVGGESDEWVEDALKDAANKDMVVVNLMDEMGDNALEEEIKEGMQAEAEGEEEAGESHEGEEPEHDEHIWLSLKNASELSVVIADALAKADAENADTYKENAKAYKQQLDNLDNEYRKAVEEGSVKTLLFGDRFPFRYLTEDYGLDYYAAFVGCSAETEASFETIAFLAGKADELGLRNIMTIEGQDHSIAESILKNTHSKDQRILTMDSMQGTSAKDVEAGVTYLSVMQSNLEVLKEAFK